MSESELITAKGYKISKPWLSLIFWVANNCPDGDISIKFARSNPTKLLKSNPDVRFDKGELPLDVDFSFGE